MKTNYYPLIFAVLSFSVLLNISQYREYKDLEGGINWDEYQFTVYQDSTSVFNNERYVGTIKLDGNLKRLINEDNK